MLHALKQRRENEEGFTLIELMVVVLIIAILLAIAIPTFLGARERANDRAAQSSLRNALTAAKTIFTDEQDYTEATTTALGEVEPSLVFDVDPSTDFKEVAHVAVQADTWAATSLSKSGKCFYIMDVASAGGGTTYGVSAGSSETSCASGDAAAAAVDEKW